MKIYLASSWKNKNVVLEMVEILRSEGHAVDAFCDEEKRISFNGTELIDTMVEEGLDVTQLTAKEMMMHWRVQEAFKEDKKYLDWADAVVMFMPCGRSAHLEAGYAAGQNKKLFSVGGFEKGEFETMYGFANGLYDYSEFEDLLGALKEK
jgi:hypothetical protein